MSLDGTTIVNRALARIGSAPIMSLEDETALARQCAAVYDDAVDLCLGLHDWAFARMTVELSRIPLETFTPINGWANAFDLPDNRLSDPLRVLANPKHPDRPLRRFALEAGRLFADETQVWATFVYRADPSTWSPVFRAAFITGLAATLAVAVASNTGLRDSLWKEAFGSDSQDMRGGLMGKAISRDVHGNPGSAPIGLAPDPLTNAGHDASEWFA